VILPENASRLQINRQIEGLAGTFVIISPDWRFLAQVGSHPDRNGGPAVFLTIQDSSSLLDGGTDLPYLAGETILGGKYAFFQGLQFLAQGYLATTVYCAPCAGETVRTSIWMLPGPLDDSQFASDPLYPIDIGGVPMEFISNGGTLRSMSASPDGWKVAISDHLGIKLFDLLSLETTAIDMLNSGILAFSPNGQYLAIAVQDAQDGNVVKILDLLSSQVVSVLKGHHSTIASLSYSPVGSRLAVGGEDEVYLWDTMGVGQPDQGLLYQTGVAGSSVRVVFSPDGKTLVTIGNGAVVLWEPDSGRQVAVLTIPGQLIHDAVFSLDGRLLLTSTAGGLQVWEVAP
jgi:WD40 repeat protein